MAKPTKSLVCPTKTQISMASAQSDQSLLCALWVANDPVLLHAHSEDSNQTGQMARLI